jgi:hypothetical protein
MRASTPGPARLRFPPHDGLGARMMPEGMMVEGMMPEGMMPEGMMVEGMMAEGTLPRSPPGGTTG